MNPAALVSIIIPCYNYGSYLAYAVDSLQHSTYTMWECIIVDDGSTDGSADIAADLSEKNPRIRVIRQKNAGLSAARNAGITASKGDYIQLLDADDAIAPQKLALQVAAFEQLPDVDVVFGDALFFHADAPEILLHQRSDYPTQHQRLKQSGEGQQILRALAKNNIMEVSCALIRRAVFDRIGLFNTAYKSYEDWEFWIRCAAQGGRFEYMPRPDTEAYIRFGHASMMGNLRRMNENAFLIRKLLLKVAPNRLQPYNLYRIARLFVKKIWLSLRA